MKIPTLEELTRLFADKAEEALAILKMKRHELEELPAGEARVRECYHAPKTHDIRMHCLEAILDGAFGVEGFEEHGEHVEYLNTGDTCSLTLAYFRSEYVVTTWGDCVEEIERDAFEEDGETRCPYCGEFVDKETEEEHYQAHPGYKVNWNVGWL